MSAHGAHPAFLSSGALAAVRATISRMQSAAAAAEAADRDSHQLALQHSTLGPVPFQPQPPHPFLAKLVKQEQELVAPLPPPPPHHPPSRSQSRTIAYTPPLQVAQLHVLGPPDAATELLPGEVRSCTRH
jgi:hypothetical protein